MTFEWDERKAAWNIAKHGVPFDYAARVFEDLHRLDSPDIRRDYSEERWLALGMIEERLFAVAYTVRAAVVRLISARKANERNNGNTMKSYRPDPKNPRQLTHAELERLDAIPIDYSDIPALGDEFFKKATAAWPPAKVQLTIRLDGDVLNWLKSNGRGYQTRINHILRAAMESQSPRRARTAAEPKKNTRVTGALKTA